MKKTIRLSTLLLLFVSITAISVQNNKKNAASAQLDLSNPDDAVKADHKIASSLKDGEECVYY